LTNCTATSRSAPRSSAWTACRSSRFLLLTRIFLALYLRLDGLGSVVADELGDLLGVLAVDALLEGAADLESLARGLRLAGVEGFIEMSRRISFSLNTSIAALDAFLGGGGQLDAFFALPRDAGVGAAEIKACRQLLGSLVSQRVVNLLPVDLADDVEG